MDYSSTQRAITFVSEPLLRQRVEGNIRLRFWAQTLDSSKPATWALAVRIISRDGEEVRGHLLPLTIGSENESFGSELKPHIVGPLTLTSIEAYDGDRIVLELGSRGVARIETRDEGQTWATFSADLFFEDLETALGEIRQSRKIGKCIYCDRTDEPLSREHIIPEGLNGELTLTYASCERCGSITSRFEGDLLKKAFGQLRVALGIRTKRPEDRPTHLPLRVRRAGSEVEVHVPVEEYPVFVAFPLFAPPAHVSGRCYSSGIDIVDAAVTQVSGPPLAELHRKYGYEYTGIRSEYQPVEFARAIAKIAYGFAVLRLGLDRIAERYVVPAVLGEAIDIGRWVGCDDSKALGTSTVLHTLTVRIEGKEIHVFVRLFAQFAAPEYHVVVGRIR